MKNHLLIAMMAISFVGCSSDSNETTNEPPVESNYILGINTGGYSGEWLRIVKNESTSRVIAGCYTLSVKTGDKVEIFGEIAAADNVPITLQLLDSGTLVKEIVLHKSADYKMGEFEFTPCDINGTGTAYTNGGKIWKSDEGEAEFIIE